MSEYEYLIKYGYLSREEAENMPKFSNDSNPEEELDNILKSMGY